MTTTPNLGLPQLVVAQAAPETTVNEDVFKLDGFASLTVLKDRDLATPPGSPAQGDRYLVAASPTGAWAGKAGYVAMYMNTAWEFFATFEGLFAWVVDEAKLLRYHSSAWAEYVPSVTSAPPASATQSGTSYTAAATDGNTYIRFTNASAVTFTIPPNSSVAFPTDTEITIEQAGAGALSVAAGSGVTINSRASDLTLAGQFSVAFLKKVATNTWTLNGDL
jgi:hypothetical protein